MLLHELATATGCSVASIKFYRREGLLPAGERLTATRQEYGHRHLERLQLIQVLREMADAPIARIRRLTALLDNPHEPLIRALEEAQAIALGSDVNPSDGATAHPEHPEHPSVVAMLERLDWPQVDSVPRRALDGLLHTLDGWGIPSDPDVLMRYAEPMAEIARGDLAYLSTEISTDTGAAEPPSNDAVVLRAVAGTIAFDRLVQVLRALGHVSLSVQASETPRE